MPQYCRQCELQGTSVYVNLSRQIDIGGNEQDMAIMTSATENVRDHALFGSDGHGKHQR